MTMITRGDDNFLNILIMNSNSDDPLARIHRLLDPVPENDLEESLSGSLHKFAREAAQVAESQKRQSCDDPHTGSVDLRNFPHADFYYKLVARVNGKLFSIYDGETEYRIGEQMHQPVKPGHQGGYYVY